MLIRFYASVGKEREENIAAALAKGAALLGDEVEIVPSSSFDGARADADIVAAFGVKGFSKEIIDSHVAIGKRGLLFDKALIRPILGGPRGYSRVGIDAGHPMKYLMRTQRAWDRWERLQVTPLPRQPVDPRNAMIFAGSSQKYCDWHALGDANEYAAAVMAEMSGRQKKRSIVYRPKPSWTGAVDIPGTTRIQTGSLVNLLPGAHVVVTHGSSAAIDAIVNGVPAITLGPCAANPVSGRSVDDVRDPMFPSEIARWHWLCNVAYCQWTDDELASGQAWEFLKQELAATA